MPRAGGVYSLPSGYSAVTGETATATQHNTPLEDLETDMNTARPIVAGGTGATTAAAARTALGLDAATSYALKSAGYTLVAADKGSLIEFDGAYTADLTAAATLGVGWYAWIYANGGDVSIDPNGSEEINGSASALTLSDGRWAKVVCTGAAFRAVANFYTTDDTIPVNDDNWSGTDLAVANGGTGRSSHTEYAVVCGGTTTTAAQQSIAGVGTAGQVLTSNGAGALPTFEDDPAQGWIQHSSSPATPSGTTTQTFGSIPAGVNHMKLSFFRVDLAGTSNIAITIGDSGGLEVTGYLSKEGVISGPTINSRTDEIRITRDDGGDTLSGTIEFTHLGSNNWVWSGNMSTNNAASDVAAMAGSKQLSAELTQISIVGGGNFENSGIISLFYEL